MSLPFGQDWAKTLEAKPAIAASWRSLDSILLVTRKESGVETERGAGLLYFGEERRNRGFERASTSRAGRNVWSSGGGVPKRSAYAANRSCQEEKKRTLLSYRGREPKKASRAERAVLAFRLVSCLGATSRPADIRRRFAARGGSYSRFQRRASRPSVVIIVTLS
jgi:hypothetical protein